MAAPGRRPSISTQPTLHAFPSASASGRIHHSEPANADPPSEQHEDVPRKIFPEVPKLVPEKTRPVDAQATARFIEPALLEFVLATGDQPIDYVAACATSVPPETLSRMGSAAHSPKRFSVHPEKSHWRLNADDLRSGAGSASACADYAARKIAAAAKFIDSFPTFDKEDVFISSKEKVTLKREQRGTTCQEREKLLRMGQPPHAAIPFYEPERNRLDDSLTEDAVSEVCNAMYELMSASGGHGVCREQDLVIGCVEAALMAWDLTSEMQGAWRVPLTLVTEFHGRRYAYVCVLIQYGAKVAALGRCVLTKMSHLPLVRQRASDVVNRFAAEFVRRGHELRNVYLGLPAECPTSKAEAATQPLIWRYLKLSPVGQEWMSLLATVDLFCSHRRPIRRALVLSLASKDLPRGFAPLITQTDKPRLKAARPTCKQKTRQRRRVPLPPLGHMGAWKATQVSDIGAWKATQDELRLSLFGDMNLVSAVDMEECSSVSSASLEEFAEDRALDYYEPVDVNDLKKVVHAKCLKVRPGLKLLAQPKAEAKAVAFQSEDSFSSAKS